MGCFTLLRARAWVLSALLTLLLYSAANFMSSAIGREAADPVHAGTSNGQVQLFTQGIAGICLTLATVALRGTQGFYDWQSTAAMFSSGVCLAAGVIVLSLALAQDFQMAPFITGMLPFNAVILVVACHVLLRERTTCVQMIAIFVAVVGLTTMATAETSSKGQLGIMYGMIVASLFAVGNFFIKYASLRGTIGHIEGACLLWLAGGTVGILFGGSESAANGCFLKGLGQLNSNWGNKEDITASNRLYLFSILSAVFMTMGLACMKLTVSIGPAAPGMAIANANAVGVLALNHIFYGGQNNAQQIVGLVISIIGVGMLSLAPKSIPKMNSDEDDVAVYESMSAQCASSPSLS